MRISDWSSDVCSSDLIYIGTIGMEGAFDAISSGEVDLNWAKEHHALCVDELRDGGKSQPHAHPAASGRHGRDGTPRGAGQPGPRGGWSEIGRASCGGWERQSVYIMEGAESLKKK